MFEKMCSSWQIGQKPVEFFYVFFSKFAVNRVFSFSQISFSHEDSRKRRIIYSLSSSQFTFLRKNPEIKRPSRPSLEDIVIGIWLKYFKGMFLRKKVPKLEIFGKFLDKRRFCSQTFLNWVKL